MFWLTFSAERRVPSTNSSHSSLLPPRPLPPRLKPFSQIQALWEDVQRLGKGYLVIELGQPGVVSAPLEMAAEDADTLKKWHASSGLTPGAIGTEYLGDDQEISHPLVSRRDVFLETCQVSM